MFNINKRIERADKRTLLAVSLLLLCAPWLSASQTPTTARGFSAAALYQDNQLDTINAFNGGLMLRIPIGKYTAGDRLDYAFTLTYNSAIWDLEKRRLLGEYRTETVPARLSNAGMGWMLTLGELFAHDGTLVYVGPDGAEHAFKSDRMHFGTDTNVDPSVLYTRDASYLRMRRMDTPEEVVRIVDFPDGTSKEFVCVAQCAPFTNEQTKFQLRKISDAFDNFVTIEREPEPAGGLWRWTVREMSEAGRTTEHYITFTYRPDDPYKWVLKTLEVEVTTPDFAPDQTITQRRWATYTFDYYDNGRVYRNRFHTAPNTITQVQKTQTVTMAVPLLKALILPNQTKWEFQYHESTGNELHAPSVLHPHYWTANYDRMLERLTYPTGGGIQYKWGTYQYPRIKCADPNPLERDPIPRASTSTGVVQRQFLKPGGAPDGEPWRYIQTYIGGTATQPTFPYLCSGSHTIRNTIVDPLANVTENLFSIVVDPDNTFGASPLNFGLPFALTIPDPLGEGRKLSTRVFKCASTDPFNPERTPEGDIQLNAIDPSRVCTPQRETYIRHESSGSVCNWVDDDNGPFCVSANRRVASARTVYRDDGDSWTQVDFSDFDGLGHYRETQTHGNFYEKNALTGSRPHGDLKVSRTTWNPTVQFSLNPESFCCQPAANARWVLETYGEMTVEDRTTVPNEPAAKGGIAKTEYFFDDRGFLKQSRTLKGGSRGDTDLLATFERVEDTGSRIRIEERYYGGDCVRGRCPNVPTGPLPIANPGGADYVIWNTYRFGSLEKREYRTCDGSVLILQTQRNEIDPATGLIMSARDTANAVTSYLYDDLNRVTKIQPPGEAATSITYTNASGSGASFTPAEAVSTRLSSGAQPVSKWQFDPFGRVAAALQRIPDLPGVSNRWSRTETRYYENGWKKEETTAGPDGVTNEGVTKYTSYDPFGRVLEMIHADSEEVLPGSGTTPLHKTAFQYKGTRSRKKTVTGLATNSSGTGTADVTELYDSQERLVAVTEASSGSQQTIYEYDGSDRLVTVTAGPQVRSFTYDNRGFMTNEKHPELGANGLTYGQFDARGHAHQTYYGSTSSRHELDTSLYFDGAERLTLIAQPAFLVNGQPRPLKSYQYYLNPNAGAFQLGKLRQTQRFNYIYDPGATSTRKTFAITERYDYWSNNHRLKTVRLSSPDTTPVVRWTSKFYYDDLGNVSGIDYPQLKTNCEASTCPQAGPFRNVSNRYTNGFLTGIPGFIDSITYHPNGLPNKVKHANNVTWVQEVTARNVRRPSKIRIEGTVPTQNWNSGLYRYDAAGNVANIGTENFTYDAVGRLVTAAMSSGTQQFTYDRHGNHISFPGSTFAPDSATNRLPTSVASYDVAGNATKYTDPRQTKYEYRYEYDPFNMIRRMSAWNGNIESLGRLFLYNVNDERVALIDYFGAKPKVRETWSARDASNMVIRDFERFYDPRTMPPNSTNPALHGWSWKRDYVHRGTTLAASIDANNVVTHAHVDHLGTPRVTTSPAGAAGLLRTYRAFGEEATSTPDPIRLKFTGHERDDASGDLLYGDVDYMHARYYNPLLGRFLTVDPIVDAVQNARRPQKWNRYAYAVNNPLRYNDPDGLTERTGWQAGIVTNKSNQTIWIAADKGVVIPLEPGETSTKFLVDTDAIVIAPGQKIDGEAAGAIKIGSTEPDVTGTTAVDLEVDADNLEWMLSAANGAGYIEPADAATQGWVVPTKPEDIEKAKQKRKELEDKRKEEEKQRKEAEKRKQAEEAKKKWWQRLWSSR